eukprot:scaffold31741_cov66-Phaeocystis_antarctica.AAC.6
MNHLPNTCWMLIPLLPKLVRPTTSAPAGTGRSAGANAIPAMPPPRATRSPRRPPCRAVAAPARAQASNPISATHCRVSHTLTTHTYGDK